MPPTPLAGERNGPAASAPARSKITPVDPLCGRTIGGVNLQLKLGAGGMGSVYSGPDAEASGAQRAIKLLSLASHESLQARFEREARIGHRLRHPLLVGVHRYGVSGDYQYMVMDLVEGEDLGHVLQRTGALGWALVAAIGRDIARALQAVHVQGMVHRDLKPGNVLLDARGRIRLADFGLASWRSGPPDLPDGVSLTRTGDVFGTPQYMAPEQFEDAKSAGPPADLYSLGVLLFEALAGRPPFQASTPHSLARLHREVPAPSLEALAADTPAELCQLVARLLAKSPAERPASAAEVADLLAQVAARGRGEPLPLHVPQGSRASLWHPDPDATVPQEHAPAPATPGPGSPAGRRRAGLLVRLSAIGLAVLLGAVLLLAEGTWLRLRLASPEEQARWTAIQAARGRLTEHAAPLVEAIAAYQRDFAETGWLREEVGRLRRTPQLVRERVYLVPADGFRSAMIHVPGGTYQVGHEEGDGEALKRRHPVRLSGFLIDRDEVSNRRYEQFLAEWQHAGGVHRCGDAQADHARPLRDRTLSPADDGPVVGTSPYDALEFALFMGRRLPSESEWEVAAAWDADAQSPRAYPWGPRVPNGTDQRYFANLSFAEFGTWLPEEERFLPQCAPSRSFEFDRSPLGLFDCAGNAAEWCQGNLPLPGKQPLRGGSLRTSDPRRALLAARREVDPTQPPPPEAGFRTVIPFER